ncbi:hypothetical protein [Streptomyces sp. Wb2n-11]|uniref:hypothetical protein n=1 Tax=Streptomyces sp. Wb2n-11 TaxID=1030533 RepID=UPI000A5F28C3|nr:hypothetical protein [Streptomyces sp. Wb2n-11]
MDATSGSGPAGALLLCGAEPDAVRPAARLLREQLLLAPAGDRSGRSGSAERWSVLVPEGRPWLDGGEPVDRVLAGWATALAVGVSWPVLALWWDADRAGFTLASGFRRQVGYVWLADGTPAGEDEAMRTFAARLGLDPVLDMEALEALTRPDPDANARSRLLGVAAVLSRSGLALPAGLAPGEPAARLREAALARPDTEPVEWQGRCDAVRTESGTAEDGSPAGPWTRGPGIRVLIAAQLAAGVPLALWGLRRRSGGWAFAGAVLVAQGTLGLAYERMRAGRTPARDR